MALDLRACGLAWGDRRDGRCHWCGATLPARRSRWCSDACSRAYARNHFWTTARAYRLDYDGHACVVCGDTEDLEVHHDPPVDRSAGGYGHGCQHHQERLSTLCRAHHGERHRHGDVQLSLVAV